MRRIKLDTPTLVEWMREIVVSCRALLVIPVIVVSVCEWEEHVYEHINEQWNYIQLHPMPKSRMGEWTEIVQVFQWLWGSCVGVRVTYQRIWHIDKCSATAPTVVWRTNSRWHLEFNTIFKTYLHLHGFTALRLNECCENERTRRKKQPFRREYLLLRYFSSANWESNKNGNYIEMHSAHNKWHSLLTLSQFLAESIRIPLPLTSTCRRVECRRINK